MSFSARIRDHIRRNLWGIIATYIALGGVAWAGAQIGAEDIRSNAILTNHIKNGQVKAADIGPGSVSVSEVNAGAVQLRVDGTCVAGESIRAIAQDGTVTCETDDSGGGGGGPATDLNCTGCVGSGDIQDGAVNTTEVDSSLTAADIADTNTLGTLEINEAGLDAAILQSRVSGNCPAGQSIRAIAQNGNATCVTVVDSCPQDRLGYLCVFPAPVPARPWDQALNQCVDIGYRLPSISEGVVLGTDFDIPILPDGGYFWTDDYFVSGGVGWASMVSEEGTVSNAPTTQNRVLVCVRDPT